ncbi:hypothetical protein [Streptomyces chrestomyceticus]|uniref:hypothetical protein n=1 Tax=Streptomyces chrestomyceticus TaxID=68185 RepID=UPI0033EAB930
MTDSPIFEYEILVPDPSDLAGRPIDSGVVDDWTGTAHDLGRQILKRWQAEHPEEHASERPITVAVSGSTGAWAAIEDPAPAGAVERALEVAIEAKLVADFAAERAGGVLADAMRDARRWGGLSANNISDRVARVMSRPTALKQLRGVWPADETYDLTVTGAITYGLDAGQTEVATCPTCGAQEKHTVFGSPAGEVRLICAAGHRFDLPAAVGRELLKRLIERPDASITRFVPPPNVHPQS